VRHLNEFPDLPPLAWRRAPGKNRPQTLEGGGKGGGGSAPQAPDPYKVADATTQTNEQTAAYNKGLNLNNYSNPFGGQNSVQVGTDPHTGAPLYQTSITASQPLQNLINSAMSPAVQPARRRTRYSGSAGSITASRDSETRSARLPRRMRTRRVVKLHTPRKRNISIHSSNSSNRASSRNLPIRGLSPVRRHTTTP
jgi:hypothetical protein